MSDIVFITFILKSCNILVQKLDIVKVFFSIVKNHHADSLPDALSFRRKPESRKHDRFYQK
jgi:hypothetical protein